MAVAGHVKDFELESIHDRRRLPPARFLGALSLPRRGRGGPPRAVVGARGGAGRARAPAGGRGTRQPRRRPTRWSACAMPSAPARAGSCTPGREQRIRAGRERRARLGSRRHPRGPLLPPGRVLPDPALVQGQVCCCSRCSRVVGEEPSLSGGQWAAIAASSTVDRRVRRLLQGARARPIAIVSPIASSNGAMIVVLAVIVLGETLARCRPSASRSCSVHRAGVG